MADQKISQLTEATTLGEDDLFVIVQGGTNKKIKAKNAQVPKVYRALLTQTGTDAPVATVLENTLGISPSDWSYVSQDTYLLTNTNIIQNKTYAPPLFGVSNSKYLADVGSGSINYEDTNGPGDNCLTNTPIEILVYS
jgi:hypothetical protein